MQLMKSRLIYCKKGRIFDKKRARALLLRSVQNQKIHVIYIILSSHAKNQPPSTMLSYVYTLFKFPGEYASCPSPLFVKVHLNNKFYFIKQVSKYLKYKVTHKRWNLGDVQNLLEFFSKIYGIFLCQIIGITLKHN